ncbi:MAG: STELLO glycosyltransferase family protein [Ginsengibacter sp.]
MKKFIVITSINPPTEAVKRFAKLKEYHLIVVGDKKSPETYTLDNCTFLSVKEQITNGFLLSKKLPFNHYCRKMIGYLEAICRGADLIVDTDDDNIPYDNWSFPGLKGDFDSLGDKAGFINIYELFTSKKIWPRGLPLSLINKKTDLNALIKKSKCNVGIWQGLADEDPDVDAIYRLTDDSPCYFEKRDPVVCKSGTLSPFNTQNTLIIKDLFSLLYLPTTVTFRYTDILRGLITQPIMWLYDYELGFTEATVIQKRNPHDYFNDFQSEIPMYQTIEKVIEIVHSSITKNVSIENNLFKSYEALHYKSIVAKKELDVLTVWLKDLSTIL